jgi:isoleucyl-tRNA synthetase
VQQARRNAGLDVSDRIELTIAGSSAARTALTLYEGLIARETLAPAVELAAEDALDDDPVAGEAVTVGEDESVRIRVVSADPA